MEKHKLPGSLTEDQIRGGTGGLGIGFAVVALFAAMIGAMLFIMVH